MSALYSGCMSLLCQNGKQYKKDYLEISGFVAQEEKQIIWTRSQTPENQGWRW